MFNLNCHDNKKMYQFSYFNDYKNDEFFIKNNKNSNNNRNYININVIRKNRNYNYNNFYDKIINQLDNTLGKNYRSNIAISSSNPKNNRNSLSYCLINNICNICKNKTTNNYSNNKYNTNNFQNYIEKKGNKILFEINNHNFNGYKKTRTSVFPANPFNSFNSKNVNYFFHINS